MSAEYDLQDVWDTEFLKEVSQQKADSQIAPHEWRTAGRVTKDKPNKEDGEWWYEAGLEFCEAWVQWRKDSGWRIWEANGQPAIEIGGSTRIGKAVVKAFIDRVFVTPAGELIILDLKTGARTPDSDLQLGIYACWLESKFGVRPQYGTYWLARKGECSPPIGLDRYSTDVIAAMFEQVNLGIENDIFVPNLGEHCRRCGVARACYAAGGDIAKFHDPLHPQYREE